MGTARQSLVASADYAVELMEEAYYEFPEIALGFKPELWGPCQQQTSL